MDWDIREKAYRVVAYSSVAFGIAAVVATCIALPLVYNYVSYVQNQMKNELDYCQGNARDIWEEVTTLRAVVNERSYLSHHNRSSRQAGYGAEPSYGPAPAPATQAPCQP